jgi:type I restriction enzyme S subunit
MAGEWVETMLGAEADLLTGFPFKSEGYTDSQDSIRLVRGDNIVQGSLRWDGVKKWPLSESAEHEVYQLREGDVVLAMDRPWIEAGLKYAAISKYDLPCLLV